MPAASLARRKLAEYRRKRDFTKTKEPSGASLTGDAGDTLHFVIQKHAASHLHFDFRLELDGVMKSWAVPKGPSLDPSVKRLAMEVEDHPIAYNTFEGTIPQGQYGGGTVMLWDRGTYRADPPTTDSAAALRKGYERGELKFVLNGERLHGSWVLVRTRRGEAKPQWLLIKHKDEFARAGADIVAEEMTSVDSGRSMEQIAEGKSRVWQSNRGGGKRARSATAKKAGGTPSPKRAGVARETKAPAKRVSSRAIAAAALEPMYASVGTESPSEDGWTYEPKYDGIRVLAFATATSATLITRNGKDKSAQFPEIAVAVQTLAAKAGRSIVLDGEIVAMDGDEPQRFQDLQSRMHVKQSDVIADYAVGAPAALFVFDLLLDGDDVLVHEPWTVRRSHLEKLLRKRTSQWVHIGESIPNDGREMMARARASGWEGVMAKRMDAPYEPGVRTKAWLKLKIEHRQELVIGGYTEPRNSREHIGALLLGYFDGDRFIYAGHTGGGFTRVGLAEMAKRLAPLERKTSPFEERPKTNEKAHWVRPQVVVEVKFSQWTADGKLRQPIFLGVRDDKDARDVTREPESIQTPAAHARKTKRGATSASAKRVRAVKRGSRVASAAKQAEKSASKRATKREIRSGVKRSATRAGNAAIDVVAQLDVIERDSGPKGSGTIQFADGTSLVVSNLGKKFFPDGHTKGDLLRYYARMAEYVLPTIADRPLVLKRFPNGVTGPSFYQQNAPDDVPDGVRVDRLTSAAGEKQDRVVGGDLSTLLWTIQLGAVSTDPWHARIQSIDTPDYCVLDLDPGPRAPFLRVMQIALLVRDVLSDLGLHGVPKTSGSTGLHVYVPLPPKTSSEAALLVAQLVATRVAEENPKLATVERSVKARSPAAVYVDYLQNIKGKTVAAAYAVRAKKGATVSTPLTWDEVAPGLDLRDFTIDSVPARVAKVGDLWAAQLKKKNSLMALRALAR